MQNASLRIADTTRFLLQWSCGLRLCKHVEPLPVP